MSVADPIKHTVGKALGRIPSGVFLMTALRDGRASAMLASWVQQASFDPPSVCVALAKGRPVRADVEATEHFALSVLGSADAPVMKRYVRGMPPGDDPFEGLSVTQSGTGLPVLADACAWLECRLLKVCDFGGDHDLLVAHVIDGAILKPAGQPFSHVRGSGFHY